MDQNKDAPPVVETSPGRGEEPRPPLKERDLNVKRVPMAVWQHARVNAVLSGIPFRDFIIAVLKGSKPLPP